MGTCTECGGMVACAIAHAAWHERINAALTAQPSEETTDVSDV